MPEVFLIQDPGPNRDLSSAQRYGRLRPVLGSEDKAGLTPGPVLFKLRAAFRDLGPEDYVCWAGGDPAGAILAGVALAETGLSKIQFLRWERERGLDGQRRAGVGFYVPTAVTLRKE